MSLINNMLKDLEKRKSRNTSLPYITLTDAKHSTSRFFPYKQVLIVSIILFFLTITILVLHDIISKPHLINVPQGNTIEKSPVIPTIKENME